MPPTQEQAQASGARRSGRPLHPVRQHTDLIVQWYREGTGVAEITQRLKDQFQMDTHRRVINRIISDHNLQPHQGRTEETPELLALVEDLVVRHKLNDAQCLAEVTRRGHRITSAGLHRIRMKNGWRRRRANIKKAECCGRVDCPTFARIFPDRAAPIAAGEEGEVQAPPAAPEVVFVGQGGPLAQAKMDKGKSRRRRAYEAYYETSSFAVSGDK